MTEDWFAPRKEFFFARYRLATVVLTPVVALSMFVLPSTIANVALVLLNLVALRIERKHRYVNPITYTLIGVGVALLIVQVVRPELYDIFFFPTFVFWTMFAVGAVLALLGQPFTNFQRTHLGRNDIHWLTSATWLVIYLLCGVICIYMPTRLELYFLPPALVAIGAALTLWFQLSYGHKRDADRVGTTNPLARSFPRDRESVREVYGFFAQNMMQSRRRSRGRTHRTVEELVDYQLDVWTDAHLASLRWFVARDDAGIKGCISAGHGVDGKMTIEQLDPDCFDLDRLRRYGKIIEMDHFAIRNDMRRSKELPLALLTTAVDYAVSVDAKLIIVEALPESEPLYRKLGCEPLLDERTVSAEGFSKQVMFMNLERIMIQAADADDLEEYHAATNHSAIERYTKRRAFASLFGLRSMCHLSADEIRRMARTEPRVQAGGAALAETEPGRGTYA
ncbi:hypothetical protein [Salinarimonas sp.]|uniref:N-acyl amino acid synthase FeeM domain-containing protein n=1 Tax=Salinarimonas sp. TaxID=2766526 RepID=UPI0032D95F55